jgi:hypothetical protein
MYYKFYCLFCGNIRTAGVFILNIIVCTVAYGDFNNERQ